MGICKDCGFQNVQDGEPCPVCGASQPQKAVSSRESPSNLTKERLLGLAVQGCDQTSAVPVGRIYVNRYRVDGFLGAGGMGRVFRAHDSINKRDVALKILHPWAEEDISYRDRFLREISILSKIHHPAVPRIFDWGLSQGQLFFVSELVEGVDVKAEIKRRGPWPISDAVELAATIADALSATHNLSVIHRDVKSSNIMITGNGSVRLLDFGLAKSTGTDITTLTQTGFVLGTPDYMSPEQFERGWIDEKSDIYSLGVVLFELLTGKLPFQASTAFAVAMMHKSQIPPIPKSIRPEVPAWLNRLVLKCLEKNPMNRFPSAAALLAELRKPRMASSPRTRHLLLGDCVVEDDPEISDWALVLSSPKEKTGWSPGMALRFEDRYYKLVDIEPQQKGLAYWHYRFVYWRTAEVFRKLVDYKEDCAKRQELEKSSLRSRLQSWIAGRTD